VSELAFHATFDGPLLGASARFGAGISAVLGSDTAGLAHFVALAGGTRAPRRGAVTFEGTPVAASPELRRVTAALYAEEPLPMLPTVSDVLRAVYAARGDRRDPNAVLPAVGLAPWGARHPRDLDASERRTLALLLALDHPRPRLLVLYEPIAAAGRLDGRIVREGVERAAGAGAVVVVATQSLDDARSLGGVPWLLSGGMLTNVATAPLGEVDGPRALVVETPDARQLAAVLAREPDVHGVRWDQTSAPDTVYVFGRESELLASAVTRVLADESLRAQSLGFAPVPLGALLASRSAPAWSPYAAPSTYGSPGVAPYAAPGLPSQAPAAAGAGVAPQPAPLPYLPAAAGPDATAPAPPDQSVSMPASFADPTRRSDGGSS
jgi:ABC-type thiamine transport system ATPase subunit